MPRKKKEPKLNPEDRKDLRNYTTIDAVAFWKIYKKLGNKDGNLKVIDTGVSPTHLVWSEYLKK